MINLDNLSDGLMGFYIVVALVMLSIAIVTYPSLRERSKKSSK